MLKIIAILAVITGLTLTYAEVQPTPEQLCDNPTYLVGDASLGIFYCKE